MMFLGYQCFRLVDFPNVSHSGCIRSIIFIALLTLTNLSSVSLTHASSPDTGCEPKNLPITRTHSQLPTRMITFLISAHHKYLNILYNSSTHGPNESASTGDLNQTILSYAATTTTDSDCPPMCWCPDRRKIARHLVPFIRRVLGNGTKGTTDDELFEFTFCLLERGDSGYSLFLQLRAVLLQQNYLIDGILLDAGLRGITLCTLRETIRINSAMESKLFPQTNRASGAVAQQLSSAHAPWTFPDYKISFVCQVGVKVVLTPEANLSRYTYWSQTNCDVIREGKLSIHGPWRLAEVMMHGGENIGWVGIMTGVPLENKTEQDDTKERNYTNTDAITSAKTIFSNLQNVGFINTKFTVHQLGEYLAWFQNATAMILINNTLGDFSCEQLLPSVVAWKSLLILRNVMRKVPQCVLGPALRTLLLNNNNISDISVLQFPNVVPAQKLKEISLDDNDIRDVGVFSKMNINALSLAGNRIRAIKKYAFAYLPWLGQLDLSRNLISTLEPGSFNWLTLLVHVNLSHNLLETFNSSMSLKLSTIYELILTYNYLLHPPFYSDHLSTSVRSTTFAANNPYACDCAMEQYVQAMKLTNFTLHKFADWWDMTCESPLVLRGHPLHNVRFTPKCPIVNRCPLSCLCSLTRTSQLVTVDCKISEGEGFPTQMPSDYMLALNFEGHVGSESNFSLSGADYLQRVKSFNVSGIGLHRVQDLLCDALLQAQSVDFSRNNLTRLPSCFQSRPSNYTLLTLYLAGNPWSCDCDNIWMQSWLAGMMSGEDENFRTHRVTVADVRETYCSQSTHPHLTRVADWESAACEPVSFLPGAIAVGIFVLLVLVLGPLLYVYRLYALVAIHTHLHVRPFKHVHHFNEAEYDYEALIVHGEGDCGFSWLLMEFLPRMSAFSHRICVPDRDFPLGAIMADCIAGAVARTKAVVCVVSLQAVTQEWWHYAFQVARAQNARCPHVQLLLVLLEDVQEGSCELPEDMVSFMKTNTFLSIRDKWFWKKLMYYLPDPPDN